MAASFSDLSRSSLQPSWAPAIVCVVLVLLLFPDARLPLGRWRGILWPFLGVAALWVVGAFGIAANAIVTHRFTSSSRGDLDGNRPPNGRHHLVGRAQGVFFPVVFVSGLGSLVKQIVSYRGATGERRQQLKWLLAGGAIFALRRVLHRVRLDRPSRRFSNPSTFGHARACSATGLLSVSRS